MKITNQPLRSRRVALWTLLCCLGVVLPARAQSVLVLDDFEQGVSRWTRNDKFKTDTGAAETLLVDIVHQTGSTPVAGSRGSALFTFKAARESWASASLRVDGARWAAMGAQRLTFWLNAGGEAQGIELNLRRTAGGVEEVFKLDRTVDLGRSQWRKVVIPLANFRSPRGTLSSRLSGVYLLQFVQRGTWDSRFFIVDQLQVEGTGRPVAPAPTAAAASPRPAVTPLPVRGTAVAVRADFLRRQGRVSASANLSIGATGTISTGGAASPLLVSATFRTAMKSLGPRLVRLDASAHSDLTDSARVTFDFRRLRLAVSRIFEAGVEPVLALPNPPLWALDTAGYVAFVQGAARAVNTGNRRKVRFFELATGMYATDDSIAVLHYNRARAALKALAADYQVGGISASTSRPGAFTALVKNGAGLDFASVQFYGAESGQPPASQLFLKARLLDGLRAVARQLDQSRFRNARLFITQANLSAAQGEAGLPLDARNVQMISAAWWGAFLANASRLADQVFHYNGVTPEWGLLDESSRAYPAYYAMWMWNTFFPPGSRRVEANSSSTEVVVTAVNTPTAHNLMLVNTSSGVRTAQIAIRGFPVLRSARMRLLESAEQRVQFRALPQSPFQTVVLQPYAIAVLQFIEPPR